MESEGELGAGRCPSYCSVKFLQLAITALALSAADGKAQAGFRWDQRTGI
jgi:hypothetical protein